MRRLLLFVAAMWMMCLELQADNVNYVECKWENEKLVKSNKTHDATPLSKVKMDGDWMTLTNGWYYVDASKTIKTLHVYGDDVHLILAKDKKLTCTGGVKLENPHKLSIYTQPDGENAVQLEVTNSYSSTAGIGSGRSKSSGDLFIHGGNMKIEGGKNGAGIGSGEDANSKAVTIYSGIISTKGGESGAGIGGGYAGSQEGAVNIYGGTVNAEGGKWAAGIGGGERFGGGAGGGVVRIYNATVTAKGGRNGAGIGGGLKGNGVLINIYSGTVTATGGKDAAGIGGGEKGDGVYCYVGSGGSPATVTATGDGEGAGIGGGSKGRGGKIEVGRGCTVTAKAGSDCKPGESDGGSALGCGYGRKDKMHYLNASVNIGLELSAQQGNATPFMMSVRSRKCIESAEVTIKPCSHGQYAYTIDVNDQAHYHIKTCDYCGHTEREEHQDTNCPCGQNQVQYTLTVYQPGSPVTAYGAGTANKIYSQQEFQLPQPAEPEGLRFVGWRTNTDPADVPETTLCSDNEDEENEYQLKPAGAKVKAITNYNLYARYRPSYSCEASDWKWSDDLSSATVTLTCKANNDVQKDIKATVTKTEVPPTSADDIGFIEYEAKVEFKEQTFTDYKIEWMLYDLELYSNQDNTEVIKEAYDGNRLDVTLKGTTLKGNGQWNAFCAPFNVYEDQLGDTPLAGATILEMDPENSRYDAATGKLLLVFYQVSEIEAGVPYLVTWTEEKTVTDPTFEDVDITTEAPENNLSDDGKITFKGTFSPVTLTGKDNTKSYLNEDNQIVHPAQDTNIEAFQCYIELSEAQPDNGTTKTDYADGSITGIKAIGDGRWTVAVPYTPGENLYDLQGRVITQPAAKGVYIYKGKKIVVK